MSWQDTAHFYANLRRMLQAGFIISEALEQCSNDPTNPYRQKAHAWATACATGSELHTLMADEPVLCRSLIGAGEHAGRLPDMCHAISAFYQQCHDTRRQVIASLAYPVFLLHFALTVPVAVFAWIGVIPSWSPFAGPACIWTVAIGIYYLFKTQPLWLAHFIIRKPLRIISVPLFSYISCLVLEAAISSGMKYPDALELTATCIPNAPIQKIFCNYATRIQNGSMDNGTQAQLSDALAAATFSRHTVDLCRNGEHSGQLEQCLQRCARMEQETFTLALAWASKIFYAAIYGSALCVSAYIILSVASGYVDTINELTGK